MFSTNRMSVPQSCCDGFESLNIRSDPRQIGGGGEDGGGEAYVAQCHASMSYPDVIAHVA